MTTKASGIRLVIYLWIELISKPTAKNHTEEVGGVRSVRGGWTQQHLTQISGINGFILLFDGKLNAQLEFYGEIMKLHVTHMNPQWLVAQMEAFLLSDAAS